MSRPLRVLIIRNAYQQDAGGAEQYALNLAIALKNSGYKPLLVTKVKKIHAKSRAERIKCIAGPWHNSQKWDRWYYLRYPAFTLWYMWIVLWHRIDVVHPQSRDDFVFATRAAYFLRKPVIWSDHADLKYVMDEVNHYNPRMRGWIVNASRHVSKIICASHSEMESIKTAAPEFDSLTVIHNGVFEPVDVQPAAKTNRLIIGTNARLVESKGIAELMQGFAALKNRNADLWLLGGVSGNQQKYQKLATKLKIANQVRFLDYVAKPNDYVAAMDIFVHASYHEAFSLAIIEAAMLGRPIIATNVGGTPEIIDSSCGILVNPKDSDAITKALRLMLADKHKMYALGKAAQKKALEEFNFQKIVLKKIIPLYHEISG
jgi:glycosyltransferase involved in cell wall biosynthesis